MLSVPEHVAEVDSDPCSYLRLTPDMLKANVQWDVGHLQKMQKIPWGVSTAFYQSNLQPWDFVRGSEKTFTYESTE